MDAPFWALVDKEDKSKWNRYSFPKPKDAENLYSSYKEILELDYKKYKKSYAEDSKVVELIESDGRLFFHMVYAVFNGPGWFKGFYKVLKAAYDSGTTDAESLLKISIAERVAGARNAFKKGTGSTLNATSATLIANTGVDIEKLVGLGPDCQAV